MKKKYLIFSLCVAVISVVTIGSCSKNSGNNSTTPPVSTSSNTVSISNFAFASNDLHVTLGTTVTWTNNDNVAHTVTADDGSFTSVNLNKGDTYSRKFSTAGTYHYHCSIHTMMTGEVIVQ